MRWASDQPLFSHLYLSGTRALSALDHHTESALVLKTVKGVGPGQKGKAQHLPNEGHPSNERGLEKEEQEDDEPQRLVGEALSYSARVNLAQTTRGGMHKRNSGTHLANVVADEAEPLRTWYAMSAIC